MVSNGGGDVVSEIQRQEMKKDRQSEIIFEKKHSYAFLPGLKSLDASF